MKKIETCFLTDMPVEAKRLGNNYIYYDLKFNGVELEVFLCDSCLSKMNDEKPVLPDYIMKGLILNNKLPERILLCSHTCDLKDVPVNSAQIVYPDFFETIPYPKTASQKMDNLLLYFYDCQNFDGENQTVRINDAIAISRNYFKNDKEFRFYIESLIESGLIIGKMSSDSGFIRVNHLGLNRIAEIENKPEDSKTCFVAMAFSEKTMEYRGAIKKALKNNKYDAVIIDEKHLESDKTIPDGILNEIRKSKFCIADFTMHRNGVYFESGYALGLGKQVIYTCHTDDFENAHFDIKQLQHVLYDSPQDLQKKLTDKIEFWIK